MAELIGVVSSAITFGTLAVQVGKSVQTLKDYWDLMRDAPDDIKWLLREIEIFSSIMADIEADLTWKAVPIGLPDNHHVSQSLNICKEAVEGLNALCKSLMKDLSAPSRLHRSYQAAKKVLRQKEIDKHVSKLNNVARLLTLSQQCYARSLMRLQPDLIASAMVHLGVICPNISISSSASEHRERDLLPTETLVRVPTLGKNRLRRRSNNYQWLLRAPYWMTSRVLEISGMKMPMGWDWQLRTYQEVRWTWEIDYYFHQGTVKDLQDLFSSGRVSPLFREQGSGRTLLHYAICRDRNGDAVEFLLDQGVDPSIEGGYMMETPLCRVLAIGKQAASNRLYPLLPYLRPLLRHSPDLIYGNAQEMIQGIFSKFHGTPEEFIFLQQHCCPTFYQMPHLARITVAAQIVFEAPNACYAEEANNTPNLIKMILGKDTLEAKELQARCFLPLTAKETTLMHCIAKRLGASQAFLRMSWRRNLVIYNRYQQFSRPADVHCKTRWQAICESWSGLFFEFLCVVNFHQIVDGKTLFIAFLEGYLASQLSLPEFKGVPWFSQEDFHIGFRAWLRDLKAAGLDLEMLGATEWYIWKNERIQREFNGGLHRVIGIAYGPRPEDWYIWLAEPSDSFVGDFWALIGRPFEIMPGSWPSG